MVDNTRLIHLINNDVYITDKFVKSHLNENWQEWLTIWNINRLYERQMGQLCLKFKENLCYHTTLVVNNYWWMNHTYSWQWFKWPILVRRQPIKRITFIHSLLTFLGPIIEMCALSLSVLGWKIITCHTTMIKKKRAP